MSDTFQFIPQFVLTKEAQFLPWDDYNKIGLDSLQKKYLLKFTRTNVYVNDNLYATRTLRTSLNNLSEFVKNIYRQDDKSLVIYTNGWAKMDTGKESIIGFMI